MDARKPSIVRFRRRVSLSLIYRIICGAGDEAAMGVANKGKATEMCDRLSCGVSELPDSAVRTPYGRATGR